MNRKFLVSIALLITLFTVACGSLNRATPAGMDKVSMEADVRGKILTAVPEKTFAVEVKVEDGGVVTLDGHAKNASDVAKIVDAANSVNGVTRVINNLHVE
jgi:osmotically-inducible protein OsmY